MLDPRDRRYLIEALRPDPGYVLDMAIGTTFSLDLLALLTAPLAFTFFGLRDGEAPQHTDPVKLLDALQRYARRIHIFCQAGRIQLPVYQHLLYAFLEQSVIQVKPRQPQCVFHPKVWVLRYAAPNQPEAPVRYRVLCLSRNLTFDCSWDTALVLNGELEPRLPRQEQLAPLSALVAELPKLAVYPAPQAALDAANQIADELFHVRFALPEGVTGLDFYALGLSERPTWPFRADLDRMAVISPFVEPGLLTRLAEQAPLSFLVSNLTELQKLPPSMVTDMVGQAYTLLDEALPEPEDRIVGESIGVGSKATHQVSELLGLHGKLYIGERGQTAYVWTGSANATNAAFGGNMECLVRLTGSRHLFGIDAFLNGRGENGFGTLLHPFRPAATVERDSLQESMDKLLEMARTSIVAMELQGEAFAEKDGLYTVHLLSTHAVRLPSRVRIRCWPITLRAETALVVNDQLSSSIPWQFAHLSRQALTTFFAFQLETMSEDCSSALNFVLNVPIRRLPAERETLLLRDILSDTNRLLQLIFLLLHDPTEDLSGFLHMLGINGDGAAKGTWRTTEIPLFETMVRALYRDPARIDSVAELIDRLRKDPEAAKLLPETWDQIWQPVWQTRQALGNGR